MMLLIIMSGDYNGTVVMILHASFHWCKQPIPLANIKTYHAPDHLFVILLDWMKQNVVQDITVLVRQLHVYSVLLVVLVQQKR